MDAAELAALGLYDPEDEHAELRLQLIDYLIGLGATTEDLLEYKDTLPGLAGVLTIRGGPARSPSDVAEASGLGIDDVRRLVRTAGFPDPDPDARVLTEGFVAVASVVRSAVALLGEEGFFQFARVMGSAMARVADAAVSAFLVNVEPAARRQDPVGLAVARANVEATSLIPSVPLALDVLFRQHLLLAQRSALPDADLVGYETQLLSVGFIDLVGSAELAEHLSLAELGAALSAFEDVCLDAVTSHGGRVVKLIGDGVLYTASDARSACDIALELAEKLHRHEQLPEVRAGLAGGQVLLRDGDVFGPVVNLAARVVRTAQPGEVVATIQVAKAAGVPFVPRGREHIGREHMDSTAGDVELAVLGRE